MEHPPQKINLPFQTSAELSLRKGCYGTYLHGNGLFLLNIYRLNLTHGETAFKQSGPYAILSGRRWAGTHFGWPCFVDARI